MRLISLNVARGICKDPKRQNAKQTEPLQLWPPSQSLKIMTWSMQQLDGEQLDLKRARGYPLCMTMQTKLNVTITPLIVKTLSETKVTRWTPQNGKRLTDLGYCLLIKTLHQRQQILLISNLCITTNKRQSNSDLKQRYTDMPRLSHCN